MPVTAGKKEFFSLSRERRMRFADVGDLRIAYRTGGRGDSALFLHGITTYSFLWKDVVTLLEDDLTFFTPDLMGCGDSSKPAGADYSLSAQADMILGFMDEAGVGKAHLVGHDIGGGIAQILAAREPERFRSLSLINSVGYDYWPVQPIVTMRIPLLRHLATAALDHGVMRMLVSRTFHHGEKVNDELMGLFMEPLKSAEGRRGFLALAIALDNSQLMSISGQLPRLPMPVLIVRGEKDIYLKPIISERLHREIKGSRYESLSTAGHYSPLDDPQSVAELILDFI
jgi:pimeloyl-ACP methyl ester carboxylesterase